jgi:hypothetical protein
MMYSSEVTIPQTRKWRRECIFEKGYLKAIGYLKEKRITHGEEMALLKRGYLWTRVNE